MELLEFTNLFLKKAYEKGLDIELDVSIDDTYDEPTPQIQINVNDENYKSFNLFYGLKDESINFVSIFELDDEEETNDEEVKKLKMLFEEDKGIFQDLLFEEYTATIHLYSEINNDDLTVEVIDEICDFLLSKKCIKVLENLKGIEK